MSDGQMKIALALSGGGFRAAFFHVGVLQHLAQRDLLRYVRVLSCVSGGSIAGAVFYLSLVRRLMVTDKITPGSPPTLRPEQLTPAEYVSCVDMTRAVLDDMARSNVRAAVFRNPWKNLVMFLSPRYSRTDRAGDMIDTRLRKGLSIDTGHRKNRFGVANQIELRSLHFDRPDLPRLVLNATTLNTGHAWRFDTDGMGERITAERRKVDKNDQLLWASFDALPEEQQNFPLGLAVAASAAFPGLFRPLPIGKIYDRRVDLMDGGAQDNQGVQALIGEDGTLPFEAVIVSDGAGQLEDEGTKSRSLIQIGRIIGIQGDRIREEQLLAAESRVKADGLWALLDLRHDLPFADVPVKGSVTSPIGVRDRLARLRTDLDAFGSLETSLLARRGYEVAVTKLSAADVSGAVPILSEVAGSSRRDKVLAAAAAQLLKPFRVFPLLLLVPTALALALLAGLVWSLRYLGSDLPNRRLWMLPLLITVFAAPYALSRLFFLLADRWKTPGQFVKVLGGGILYAVLGALAWVAGPTVVGWLDVQASRSETVIVAAALLALPPFLPFLLSLLLFAEGMWWKRLADLEAN